MPARRVTDLILRPTRCLHREPEATNQIAEPAVLPQAVEKRFRKLLNAHRAFPVSSLQPLERAVPITNAGIRHRHVHWRNVLLERRLFQAVQETSRVRFLTRPAVGMRQEGTRQRSVSR